MNAILSRPVFRQVALVAAAVAAFAAAPAWAESPTVNTEIDRAVSTKTRAEVIAELHQARANGSLRVWSISYNPLAEARSVKTREEARAEVLASSLQQPMTGEESGSFAMVMPQHHGASIRVALR